MRSIPTPEGTAAQAAGDPGESLNLLEATAAGAAAEPRATGRAQAGGGAERDGRAGGRHRAAKDGWPQERDKPEPKGSWLSRFAKDAAFVLVAAMILSFLLKTFLIQSFYIPSESMEPTLAKWDRVIVTKLAPSLLDVHRGDIIVLEDPGDWVSQNEPLPEPGGVTGAFREVARAIGFAPADSSGFLIKRVIGVGGDRVACRGPGSPVTVNGFPLDETYIANGASPSSAQFEVLVPEGAVWVMGDNRDHSADSRSHMSSDLGGAVSLDQVVGVAQFRSWPLSRAGLLRNPGSVFAGVPDGSTE
ncbi:MAG: signal peptidase I [Bifidobacteriaceae bacterium]|jgi:signal peptidase I|nr:signal peptidase I [Bifidobacteriaceae bacterium]